MEDDRNFKAQADKNPKIVNGKNDLEVCECYALSFHISTQTSKEHFNHFASKSPMAYKRLGTNISEGKLEILDGVSGDIETNGHFNFHHIKDNNFKEKFKIVEKL